MFYIPGKKQSGYSLWAARPCSRLIELDIAGLYFLHPS
jgi:hypothetical protein